MTRKLATLRIIKELVEIPGADRIELAIIDGWQVVVQKGHKVGDLVVYFEIDSFLPESDPRYASFSERFNNWGDKRGMRVKTIKLRQRLSQGVIMPLHEFPEVKSSDYTEGTDVTELLGIEKWEPIEKADTTGTRVPGSSREKRFPAFIRKTDQERIQNYGHMVQRASKTDETFEVTMKKDGSSLTVFRVDPSSFYYKDAREMTEKKLSFSKRVLRTIKEFFKPSEDPVFGICSRNLLLPLKSESNFHTAVYENDLLLKLDNIGGSYALQGEVVAPNIQDNHERVNKVEFHLFDIYDIDRQVYVSPSIRRGICDEYGIPHVTVLAKNVGLDEVLKPHLHNDDIVKAALAYAEGPGDNPGVIREGVVFKSETRDFSFKAVSNAYLLKTGK